MFACVLLHCIHIFIFMKLKCLRPVCVVYLCLYLVKVYMFASSLLSLFVLDRVLDLRSVVAPLI